MVRPTILAIPRTSQAQAQCPTDFHQHDKNIIIHLLNDTELKLYWIHLGLKIRCQQYMDIVHNHSLRSLTLRSFQKYRSLNSER